MLKAVTLKEIERIFAVIDPMGISREAVEIPLRTEHPGRFDFEKRQAGDSRRARRRFRGMGHESRGADSGADEAGGGLSSISTAP